MKKLYEKNEVYFALVWIALYVLIMNTALQFCDGFDNLASKTVEQIVVPVICILLLSATATVWIIRNDLTETYDMCRFKDKKGYILFVPLILMSCINLKAAIIVSAVTFGAGHIVNLANTADTIGVFLQVCYAIGFLYTVIVYKGGSLWTCIISHMFVNGSSVFACE